MESNGKSVTLDGEPVRVADGAPSIWGEPGDNAQHSFFQLLHQGTPRAALDFLLPAQSSCGDQAAPEPRHRQLPGAGRGLHGRAVGRGRARGARAPEHAAGADRGAHSAQGAPGEPPEHDRAVRAARSGDARQADRALRAQGVHPERGLGDQRVRSVGRGARQEARRAAGAGRSGSAGRHPAPPAVAKLLQVLQRLRDGK